MTRQIVQRHQLKSLASMSSDDAFTVSILIAIDNKMPVFRNRLLSDVWPTNQRSLSRYSVRTENPLNHPPLKADSVALGLSMRYSSWHSYGDASLCDFETDAVQFYPPI